MTRPENELTVLLIAPDQDLARQFELALSQARTFQMLAALKVYPSQQTLDIRLRQLRPDVVLLDLGSDLDAAAGLIPFLCSVRPPVSVIGLHRENHSEAIVRSLRLGASEFLHAPFDAAMQREAGARIRRLRKPEIEAAPEDPGKVIVFSSAKPGSGSSTLALHIAHSIRKLTSARVLLADLDLLGGTLGDSLKLKHAYSALDALRDAERLDSRAWASRVTACAGLDVLPPPDEPSVDAAEPQRMHDMLERARSSYDWIILDLPVMFHRMSLLALSESDRAFLVATPELPSLHLARRAVAMLADLGFGEDRFQVILNRTSRRDGIGGSDVEKILGCRVKGSLPNDYGSLERGGSGEDSELQRGLLGLAAQITGAPIGQQRRVLAAPVAAPAMSEG